MLHIILGILKVIGILLLALLLLILLAVLSAAFVPVRYRGMAVKDGEELSARLHVSWLLHAVSVRLEFDAKAGTRRLDIRLLGISTAALKQFFAGWKQRLRKRSRKKQKRVSAGRPAPDQNAKHRPEAADEESHSESDVGSVPPEDSAPEPKPEQDDRKEGRSPVRRFLRFSDKIQNLLYKIGAFCGKMKKMVFRSIPDKGAEFRRFAEDYEIQALFFELKDELFRLLLCYRPRRIRGWLRFGTGDPASTGELTGLLYLLLPAGAEFRLEPDFNAAVLETRAEFAGHIRACHLIRTAWHLFRNKKLRRLIARIRGKGDSRNGR